MKAEHRHELKTNDLAKTLMTFGDYAREYGGRVVLGIAIVVLVIVLINRRIASSSQAALQLKDDLAFARQQVDRLRSVSMDFAGRPSVTPADVENVPTRLNKVKANASEKSVRAEACVAEGDYYWSLANYPSVSGLAATRVVVPNENERRDYLKKAADAYQQVTAQYADQPFAVTAAHFGLAAIAENNRDWDQAKKQYEAVQALSGVAKMFKELAGGKLKRLEEMQKPVLLGQVPEKFEPPVMPSTAASTTPTTTAAPATRSVIPTPAKPVIMPPATKAATSPAAPKATPAAKPAQQPEKPKAVPATRPAATRPSK